MRFKLSTPILYRPSRTETLEFADEDPINLLDVKDRLLVTHTEDDSVLQQLIEEAGYMFEEYTGKTLMQSTMRLYFNNWPLDHQLPLGGGHVTKILSIKLYYDNFSDEVIYNRGDDVADDIGEFLEVDPRCVDLFSLQSFKNKSLRRKNGLEITFTVGYEEQYEVPPDIQASLYEYVEWKYLNDGEGEMPSSIQRVWNRYRTSGS